MSLFKQCLLSAICAILLVLVHSVSVQAEKQIPATKFGQNAGGPTIKFLYCYSCGYRKAFEEYVNIIHEKYPEISTHGANYDPPGLYLYLSKVVLLTKLFLIIIIISSFDIFGIFGYASPYWWRFCTENKLYACMMTFFVGNMLEAQLISSGAFEISLNDVPVWSKIQTGRIPAPQELFQIIDSHLQFTTKKIGDSDFINPSNRVPNSVD